MRQRSIESRLHYFPGLHHGGLRPQHLDLVVADDRDLPFRGDSGLAGPRLLLAMDPGLPVGYCRHHHEYRLSPWFRAHQDEGRYSLCLRKLGRLGFV